MQDNTLNKQTGRASSLAVQVSVMALLGAAIPLVLWGALHFLAALVVVVIFIYISLIRPLDPFSPKVLFPVIWVPLAIVGHLVISVQQAPWNATTTLCVVLAPICWLAGVYLFDFVSRPHTPSLFSVKRFELPYSWNTWKSFLLFAGWLLVSFLLSMYEFKYVLGAIPIFSRHWEELRLQALGGYKGQIIHLLAYSFIVLAIVLQVHILSQKKILCLENIPFFFLLAGALGVGMLWGSRHTIFIPLSSGVVAFHYLRRRFKLHHLILIALAGLLFIAAVGFLRTRTIWQRIDLEYADVLQNMGYPSTMPPVVAQAHNTIAANFEIFRRLTVTFPDVHPYQMGRYTFFAFYSLLPGKQYTLGELQNLIWHTGFYGNLTSTYMGWFYVDFGVPGVILFTIILGMIVRAFHLKAITAPSLRSILFYSYICSHVILMAYDNTFAKLKIWFDLLFLWIADMLLREPSEL